MDHVRLQRLERLGPLIAVPSDHWDGPAKRFRLNGALGEIGLIGEVSSHFCSDCNRLRLTPDGKMEDVVTGRQLLRLRLCSLFTEQNGRAADPLPDPLHLQHGMVEIERLVFQIGIPEGQDTQARRPGFSQYLLEQTGLGEMEDGKTFR